MAQVPLKDIIEPVNADGKALKKLIDGNTGRLEILDELRGLCVLLMLCYHGFYLLSTRFVLWRETGQWLYEFFQPWEPIVAAVFILISGYCTQLSGRPEYRALLLVCAAMVISFVTMTVLPRLGIRDGAILFGIIHLLAAGKLLFWLLKKLFDKIPGIVGAALSLVLFFYTAPVAKGEFSIFKAFHLNLPPLLYQTDVLFFLGFHTERFASWDYFPLLPYLFLFFFGVFTGKLAKRENFPAFCYKKMLRPLGFLGRKSLWVYMLHLPVLYGIFTILQQWYG